MKSVHLGLLSRETNQQLEYLEPFIFDIKNIIYSIDAIFKSGESVCYGQIGYSDLIDKTNLFYLPRQIAPIYLNYRLVKPLRLGAVQDH